MKPPYDLTSNILKLITSISEKIGEISANLMDRPSPRFDKGNLKPELFKGGRHLRLAGIFIEKHGIKTVDSTKGRRKFFAFDLDRN